MTLAALVIAIAAQLGRGTPSPAVVDAIASATTDEHEAALLTVYAAYESAYRPGAVGDGGRSCGVWQQACARVSGLPLETQARIWLSDVRASSLAAVDSSARRAARRQRLAERALAAVR